MKFLQKKFFIFLISLGAFFYNIKASNFSGDYFDMGGVVARNGDTIDSAVYNDTIMHTGLTLVSGTLSDASSNAFVVNEFLSFSDGAGTLSLSSSSTGLTLDNNVTLSNNGILSFGNRALTIAHGYFDLAGNQLTLGSNLNIAGLRNTDILKFSNGIINLNGFSLTISNLTLSGMKSSSFIGSSIFSSCFIENLILASAYTLPAGLSYLKGVLDLASYQLTRASTLTLSDDLSITSGSLNFSGNTIDLNGKTLTLTGNITLSSSLVISSGTIDFNGYQIDCATNNLTFNTVVLKNFKTNSLQNIGTLTYVGSSFDNFAMLSDYTLPTGITIMSGNIDFMGDGLNYRTLTTNSALVFATANLLNFKPNLLAGTTPPTYTNSSIENMILTSAYTFPSGIVSISGEIDAATYTLTLSDTLNIYNDTRITGYYDPSDLPNSYNLDMDAYNLNVIGCKLTLGGVPTLGLDIPETRMLTRLPTRLKVPVKMKTSKTKMQMQMQMGLSRSVGVFPGVKLEGDLITSTPSSYLNVAGPETGVGEGDFDFNGFVVDVTSSDRTYFEKNVALINYDDTVFASYFPNYPLGYVLAGLTLAGTINLPTYFLDISGVFDFVSYGLKLQKDLTVVDDVILKSSTGTGYLDFNGYKFLGSGYTIYVGDGIQPVILKNFRTDTFSPNLTVVYNNCYINGLNLTQDMVLPENISGLSGIWNLNSYKLSMTSNLTVQDNTATLSSGILVFNNYKILGNNKTLSVQNVNFTDYIPNYSITGNSEVYYKNTTAMSLYVFGDLSEDVNLYQDLILSGTSIYGSPTIDLNGFNLILNAGSTLNSDLTLSNIPEIICNSNLYLNFNNLNISTTTTLDMNQSSIDFDLSGKINIGAGQRVIIKNGILNNLRTGSINFGDSSSTLILSNVTINLADDSVFNSGRIEIDGPVYIYSELSKNFNLDGTFLGIFANGDLTFEPTAIFKYSSGTLTNNGKLTFSSSGIDITDSGLAINSGKIYFDKSISILGPNILNFTGATFKKLAKANYSLLNGASFVY